MKTISFMVLFLAVTMTPCMNAVEKAQAQKSSAETQTPADPNQKTTNQIRLDLRKSDVKRQGFPTG